MPKAPILWRTMLFTVLRDGSFMSLDWNMVNTSIGGMFEARSIGYFGSAEKVSTALGLVNEDPYDTSFNDRLQVSPEQMGNMGTSGDLKPRTYNNTQP